MAMLLWVVYRHIILRTLRMIWRWCDAFVLSWKTPVAVRNRMGIGKWDVTYLGALTVVVNGS